ncbi:MAG: glycosyltransferase [Saprospiraceae bacterium]|nr:glycosyltransferase [Candidatus Brachybacter algidus]
MDDGNPASINNQQLIDWVESGIVKYFGQIKDIRPLIQKSDCVVLPSYREGMSRLLTEAIAMEKPVISSDTSGCKDIVDDGENGFLVPIKNSEALLDAFVKFLDLDEPERQYMGKKGRLKAINEFDDQVIANQFLSFIDSVD